MFWLKFVHYDFHNKKLRRSGIGGDQDIKATTMYMYIIIR